MASKYPIFANKNPNCKAAFFRRMWFKSKCDCKFDLGPEKRCFLSHRVSKAPDTAWPCKQLFSGLILYLDILDTQYQSWFPNF